jgi:hypothetical protein
MAKLQTVKIIYKNKRGFKVINESDFDKSIHKEFTSKDEAIVKKAEATEKKIKEDAEKKVETSQKTALEKLLGDK